MAVILKESLNNPIFLEELSRKFTFEFYHLYHKPTGAELKL